jgi:hypothetical protein
MTQVEEPSAAAVVVETWLSTGARRYVIEPHEQRELALLIDAHAREQVAAARQEIIDMAWNRGLGSFAEEIERDAEARGRGQSIN